MKQAKIIEIFEEGSYNHGETNPDKAKRIDIYTDENDGYGFGHSASIREINERSIDSFISYLQTYVKLGYKISFAYLTVPEYEKNGTKSIFES